MSYTRRCYGLCAKEVSIIKKWQRWRRDLLMHYLRCIFDDEDHDVILHLEMTINQLSYAIRNVMVVDIPPHLVEQRPARTIESFSDAECWRRFRVRKDDLYRVKDALQIPHSVRLENRSKFSGEEVLLFSLNRFTTCAWTHDLLCTYGRDATQWYRAFHWFIRHMISRFAYLLTDMLPFWKKYIPLMAEKIRHKLFRKSGIYRAPGTFRIFGFIDCTVISSCRPGSGPAERGENAPRYNNFIQMAFYNGWKHHHGTKFQSVELPNGMCMHMYGPKSFRACDLNLLARSNIVGKIRTLLLDMGPHGQFVLYGDGIYPFDTHLISKHIGEYLTAMQLAENRAMTTIRIANEWDYGVTANIFPFVKWRAAQKLRKHKDIAVYYFVATILRNITCTLYGNVSSSYFESDDDELEDACDITLEEYLDPRHRPAL